MRDKSNESYLYVMTAVIVLLIGTIKTQPASAQRVVTLDECLTMAVGQNNDLKVEEQKLIGAKAKRAEVMSHLLPNISLNGAYLQVNRPMHIIDWDYLLGGWSVLVPDGVKRLTTITMDKMQVGSLTAIQPIFMGGKIIQGTKMADAAVRLTTTMSETKRTEVEEDVEKVYWQVVSLASKERLVNELVQLLGDARHDVDLAIKTGVATRADGLAIRVKQSEAEVKLHQVQNGLHLSQMLLAQKCGLGSEIKLVPADIIEVDSTSLPTPIGQTPIDTTAINKYIEKRSEIRSLRLADTIFTHKMGVERADMLPKVFMIGSYSTVSPNPFSAPRDRFQGSWMVGVGVSIPITDILTGGEKVRQARVERDIKRLELDDAREKIRLQMQQALLKRKEGFLELEAAKEALAHANENLHYARVGYSEGVIPLLSLTTAQTAWMKAHDAYIDAYIKTRTNESQIKHIFTLNH